MGKTGESYTAARANLLDHPKLEAVAPSRDVVIVATPPDYDRLAGMSGEVVKVKTGCAWDRWVWALDGAKAYQWPHREIAAYIAEKYHLGGWWAQAVTVGYERIKGLRQIGQRRDGGFEVNKSKTVAVPLSRLY